MRGYKVFKPDWTCRDMQYEVGKSYEMTDEPVICERGFHFCEKLIDCFTIMNLILITKWLKSKPTVTLILRKAIINAVPIKLKLFTN